MDYDNRQAEREYDLASLAMTLEERAKRDLSEAGKMARDMGYELGSEEGNKFIRKYYDDKEAVKILQLAELRKNANTLSNTDVNIREETVKTLDSATLVISNLEEALTYNEDALTNSFFDTVRKTTEGIISTDSTAYKATQNLEQILAKNAISSLKALFGGQLSDGERQASLDLEGLSSASKDVRRDIIQRALDTMRIVENKLNNKVRKISSGKYSQIEE
jgi:DNA polymerase II large subunit